MTDIERREHKADLQALIDRFFELGYKKPKLYVREEIYDEVIGYLNEMGAPGWYDIEKI